MTQLIDYSPLQAEATKFQHVVEQQQITFDDLRAEVNRLYDVVANILNAATDADMIFVPYDSEANDPYAATEAEKHIGWTLGHLVAHITATNEESAVFASLLARGIPQGGRIRTETPWAAIDTVQKARQRLEESRRIVLAYLNAIPDTPDLTTEREFSNERVAAYFGPINAPAAMLTGLAHHAEHIEQFHEVYRQAKAANDEA
jgi:hypothetical protein